VCEDKCSIKLGEDIGLWTWQRNFYFCKTWKNNLWTKWQIINLPSIPFLYGVNEIFPVVSWENVQNNIK